MPQVTFAFGTAKFQTAAKAAFVVSISTLTFLQLIVRWDAMVMQRAGAAMQAAADYFVAVLSCFRRLHQKPDVEAGEWGGPCGPQQPGLHGPLGCCRPHLRLLQGKNDKLNNSKIITMIIVIVKGVLLQGVSMAISTIYSQKYI